MKSAIVFLASVSSMNASPFPPAPSFNGLPASTSQFRPSTSVLPSKAGINFANSHEMSQQNMANPFPQYRKEAFEPQTQYVGQQMQSSQPQMQYQISAQGTSKTQLQGQQGMQFDPIRPALASKQGIQFVNQGFQTGHNFDEYQKTLYPGYKVIDTPVTAVTTFQQNFKPTQAMQQNSQQSQQFLPQQPQQQMNQNFQLPSMLQNSQQSQFVPQQQPMNNYQLPMQQNYQQSQILPQQEMDFSKFQSTLYPGFKPIDTPVTASTPFQQNFQQNGPMQQNSQQAQSLPTMPMQQNSQQQQTSGFSFPRIRPSL